MVRQIEPDMKKELIGEMEKADKSITTKFFEYAVGASGEDTSVYKSDPDKHVQKAKVAYEALGSITLKPSHELGHAWSVQDGV
eukprot:4139875-Amphidinium_carterae.1